MSIEIKRDIHRDDVWWDANPDGTYNASEVFKISANGASVKGHENIAPILEFNQNFDELHPDIPSRVWTQIGHANQILHVRVPVGYAQAFQNEFNAEFN